MRSMKQWMLATALAAGTLGLATAPAHAARIGIGIAVGGPAYVPACPGPGYVWVGGYWANGYWTPGYWNYVGVRVGGPVIRGGVVYAHGPFYGHRYFRR